MNCAPIITTFGRWDYEVHETSRYLIGEQGKKAHLELKSLKGRAAILLFDQRDEGALIGACCRASDAFNGVYDWIVGIQIPIQLSEVFREQLRREITVLKMHAESLDFIGRGRGTTALVHLLKEQRQEIEWIDRMYLGWGKEVSLLSGLRRLPEVYVFGDQEAVIRGVQLVQIGEGLTEESMSGAVVKHNGWGFGADERRVNLESGEVIDGPEQSGFSTFAKILLFELMILMRS